MILRFLFCTILLSATASIYASESSQVRSGKSGFGLSTGDIYSLEYIFSSSESFQCGAYVGSSISAVDRKLFIKDLPKRDGLKIEKYTAETTRVGFEARQFFGDSFYARYNIGFGPSALNFNVVDEATGSKVNFDVVHQLVFASIGLGNQWILDSGLYFGATWLGYFFTNHWNTQRTLPDGDAEARNYYQRLSDSTSRSDGIYILNLHLGMLF